jgi:hypothetical protein
MSSYCSFSYQLFKYHKGEIVPALPLTGTVTKNQYARDDPAFLVLLSFWLCCTEFLAISYDISSVFNRMCSCIWAEFDCFLEAPVMGCVC